MSEPRAEVAVLEEVPQLWELVEELHGVRKRWYRIGLQLKVSDEALDGIDAECKDSHEDALLRMLKEWRRQGVTSWTAVVKALRSRSVGESILAKNLEDRYIGTDQRRSSIQCQQAVLQHDQQLIPYRSTPEASCKSDLFSSKLFICNFVLYAQ